MVQSWRRKLKDNFNRTMMQGEDESDVLKNTFPLPRKQELRTRMLPSQDIPEELRSDAQRVDLHGIAKSSFASNRCTELAMLLLAHSGIGRGGEVKFLTCSTWFFDKTFNVPFAQWFQRKNLKTNPSGFVPDFESPHLCVFFCPRVSLGLRQWIAQGKRNGSTKFTPKTEEQLCVPGIAQHQRQQCH